MPEVWSKKVKLDLWLNTVGFPDEFCLRLIREIKGALLQFQEIGNLYVLSLKINDYVYKGNSFNWTVLQCS